MSTAIRLLLLATSLLCAFTLFFPEDGWIHSPANPVALMLITGLAAILWPSGRKRTLHKGGR